MQLQRPVDLGTRHTQHISSSCCRSRQFLAQKPTQRLHVAYANQGRAWGSGWGRKKGQATVQKPTNVSMPQEQQQERQHPEQGHSQQPQLQQTVTKEDYKAAYDAIASTIHRKFLQANIFACCQPASLLFFEAVTKVNTNANPRFVLGYMNIAEPSPGGPDVCGRHLWVELGGKQYDIGQTVAIAMLQNMYGSSVPLPKYGLERPPDAMYLGWDSDALARDVVPKVTTEEQDAALIRQFESETGRKLYWSGTPPQLLAIRDEILSKNWLKSNA